MAEMLRRATDRLPRKMLSMSGESLRKPLADQDGSRVIGRAIEMALAYSDITKQQASATMGYGTNQSAISRWISGVETAQFQKLWMLGPKFRHGLIVALAREHGGFRLKTTLECDEERAS